MDFWDIGYHLRMGRWVTRQHNLKEWRYRLNTKSQLEMYCPQNGAGVYTEFHITGTSITDYQSNNWKLLSIEQQVTYEQELKNQTTNLPNYHHPNLHWR